MPQFFRREGNGAQCARAPGRRCWPADFRCSRCGDAAQYRVVQDARGLFQCHGFGLQTLRTADTLMMASNKSVSRLTVGRLGPGELGARRQCPERRPKLLCRRHRCRLRPLLHRPGRLQAARHAAVPCGENGSAQTEDGDLERVKGVQVLQVRDSLPWCFLLPVQLAIQSSQSGGETLRQCASLVAGAGTGDQGACRSWYLIRRACSACKRGHFSETTKIETHSAFACVRVDAIRNGAIQRALLFAIYRLRRQKLWAIRLGCGRWRGQESSGGGRHIAPAP